MPPSHSSKLSRYPSSISRFLDVNSTLTSMYEETDKPPVYDTGFTATVVVGRHRLTEEQVAVKVVNKNKLSTVTECDYVQLGRLGMSEMDHARAEVRIHASLPSHPNIVPLLASEENSEHILFITPLAEDGDLWQHIRFSATLSEAEAQNLMCQLLSGLAHMHTCGLLHGDVKPHNILLFRERDDNGREHSPENTCPQMVTSEEIKLMAQFCDFGLSEQVGFIEKDGKLVPNMVPFTSVRGSNGYFSPEMINHQNYGFPIDVFALGVIMFRILGGYEPFYPSTSYQEVVEFEDPSWESISNEAKDLIQNMLKLNPNERITADAALSHPWFSIRPEPAESTLYFFPRNISHRGLKNFPATANMEY